MRWIPPGENQDNLPSAGQLATFILVSEPSIPLPCHIRRFQGQDVGVSGRHYFACHTAPRPVFLCPPRCSNCAGLPATLLSARRSTSLPGARVAAAWGSSQPLRRRWEDLREVWACLDWEVTRGHGGGSGGLGPCTPPG